MSDVRCKRDIEILDKDVCCMSEVGGGFLR